VHEPRFDAWTRMFADLRSRRDVARVMIGAAALLLAGRNVPGTSAHHGRSGPGEPCRTNGQCLGADAPLVCAWNGFDYDGELNCCTYEGNRCGFDEACCGLATCRAGRCHVHRRRRRRGR
jgi:hypothetical protein